MDSLEFETLRRRVDSKGPYLNIVKDKFFNEIYEEHTRAYSSTSSSLYSLSCIDDDFKIDLSPIGIVIYKKERFIFLKNEVLKEISFHHKDEFRKEITHLFSIIFNNNGHIFFDTTDHPVGLVGNGTNYDLFFDKLFNELNINGLIYNK